MTQSDYMSTSWRLEHLGGHHKFPCVQFHTGIQHCLTLDQYRIHRCKLAMTRVPRQDYLVHIEFLMATLLLEVMHGHFKSKLQIS